MPDASATEKTTVSAEQIRPAETEGSRLDRAIESGNLEALKAHLMDVQHVAGEEVDQYSKAAEDAEDPSVGQRATQEGQAMKGEIASITAKATEEIKKIVGAKVEGGERVVQKLQDRAESALVKKDEQRMEQSVESIEDKLNGQIASREQLLEALQSQSSTPAIEAQINQLEQANEIDRQTIDRRKAQLEVMRLTREKKEVDLQVEAIEKQLPTLPEAERQEVQLKLDGLKKKQQELGAGISAKTDEIAAFDDSILQLSRLEDKYQEEAELASEGGGGMQAPDTEKNTHTSSDGVVGKVAEAALHAVSAPDEALVKAVEYIASGPSKLPPKSP